MREDCRHYQSRRYATGDTARFCVLDLAPEAPWRCPSDCPRHERRLDGGWARGDLINGGGPDEPEHVGDIAALLDHAASIVNAAGPGIVSEVHAERAKAARRVERAQRWKFWRRWLR